jgi:hypothetical protein
MSKNEYFLLIYIFKKLMKEYIFSRIDDYINIFCKKYGHVDNIRDIFLDVCIKICEEPSDFYQKMYEKIQEKEYRYIDHYIIKYIHNTLFVFTKNNYYMIKNGLIKSDKFEDYYLFYNKYENVDLDVILINEWMDKQKDWKWKAYKEYLIIGSTELTQKYNFSYHTFLKIKKFCETKLKKKFNKNG